MAMVYAWLDKEPQMATHLALAKQLVQLMDNNPEGEEVPMVGGYSNGRDAFTQQYLPLAVCFHVCSVAFTASRKGLGGGGSCTYVCSCVQRSGLVQPGLCSDAYSRSHRGVIGFDLIQCMHVL